MMTLTHFFSKVNEKLFAFFFALVALFPSNPLNMPLSYRDQGVFLYIAWRLLSGEVPYRDIWDHKPPVIYFVDAIGLALTPGSRWGVWLIELAALFIAALLAHKLLKEAFGALPATSTLLISLMSLTFAIEGGNHTTEFALPLQFGCLVTALGITDRGAWFWRGYLIGILGAVAFLLKQTMVGIPLAIILYLILIRIGSREPKKLMYELISLLLGGSTILVITVILFSRLDALPQLVDAAFKYNFTYSSAASLTSRVTSIIKGMGYLSETWLTQFAFIGVASAVVLVTLNGDFLRESTPLVIIGLIALPIELLLVGISGNSYPHYYVALIPIFSIFTALAVRTLLNGISQLRPGRVARLVFIASLLVALGLTQLRHYRNVVISYRHVGHPDVVSFVKSHTSEDDYVLLWGAEASVNFFTSRRSPTKYIYQYPLYMQGYTNGQMIEEFLKDVVQHRPRLIIDARDASMPFLKFPYSSPTIESLTNDILSDYRSTVSIDSWIVYEYVGTVPQAQ